MKRTGKMKLLALVLAVVLVFGMMPGSLANAAVKTKETEVVEETSPADDEALAEEVTDENEYGIRMLATATVDYVDADGNEQEPVSATEVTDSENTWTSADENQGWYVVDSDVTISSRISVSGAVNLILADNCTLTASAGITVQSNNSLTIYGQTAGNGKLVAEISDTYNAAIGGISGSNCGVVTINGGTVTASAGSQGAGIGGAYNWVGGTININGGTVTASAGTNGAGIGSGYNGHGGTINISGGTVTASAGNLGAGIGAGQADSVGCTINISGGTVTAKGSSGAGIGAGSTNWTGKQYITISGGTVTASATYGAGIGGTSASFTTGANGNAFIVASKISDTCDKENWSGAIIVKNDGQVYGKPTLTTDAEIPSGDTLLIPEDTGLTINSGTTLTNSGTVYQNWGSTFYKNNDGYGPYVGEGDTYYQIVNNLNYSWSLAGDGTTSYSGNTYALENNTVSTSKENEITLTNYTITKQDESTETSDGRSFTMPDEPVQLSGGFAMIPIPEPDTKEFTYNGTEQTYTLKESEYYTISGNVQTNAGDYTVTVSLNDTNTSMWVDGTTEPITYTFVINKADQSISYAEATVQKLDYDDPFINELTREQVSGNITYSFTTEIGDDAVIQLDETSGKVTIIGPGVVTVTATAAETDNYNEATASYLLIVNSDEVKGKIDVNNDSVSYDEELEEYVDALTYDGEDLELEMLVELDEDEQAHKTQDITYQWYNVAIDRTEVTPINGATNYTYMLTGDAVNAGDYTYLCVATIPYDNGYEHTVYSLIEITINQADNNLTIITESLDKIYDGSAVVVPEITADFGKESVKYTWYQVNGDVSKELDEAPSEIGNYKVVASIPGTDNYKGASAELAFTISAIEITEDMFTVDTTDETYSGSEITKEITSELVKGTDYTVSYEDNKNAGKATIIITGIGIYTGTVNYTFTIAPQEFTADQFTVDTEDETYTGSAITKTIDSSLTEGTDYLVEYTENINAGEAAITITGIGNYTGTVKANFTILKAESNSLTILTESLNKTYDGAAVEPEVEADFGADTVKYIWYEVDENGDVTGDALDAAPSDVGTYKVVASIEETASYAGAGAEMTFTIKKAAQDISYAVTSMTKLTTDSAFTNPLTKGTVSEEKGGGITYDSSDTTVAKVDAASGKVTIVGSGKVTITATAAETANYAAAAASYVLTVNTVKTGTIGTTATSGGTTYKVTSGTEVAVTKTKKNSTSVTIPATVKVNGKSYKVTSISDKAFSGNTKLKKVTIGSNVTSIGANAFAKCTNLKKVTIGKNVTKIGKKAFFKCKSLKTVVIKTKKLKSVGAKAFKGIKKNAKFKVPKNKKKAYKKLLNKKAGIKKTMKIK